MITLAYLLSGIFAFAATIMAWRYKKLPGRHYFLILSALTGLVTFASSIEYNSIFFETKLWWRNVQQIGFFYSPVMVLLLALVYSRNESRITRKLLILVHLVPTAALLLIFTNSYHHLMRKSVSIDTQGTLHIVKTTLNSALLLHGFFLFVISFFLFVRTMIFTNGTQRKQLLMLILGLFLPFFVSLLRNLGLFPETGYAASVAVTYCPGFLFLVWGMLKYQLFEAVPIARNKLFDVMKEGIVVLDAEARIVDTNLAARQMLSQISGSPVQQPNGKKLEELASGIRPWIEAHSRRSEEQIELSFAAGAESFHLSVKISPVMSGKNIFTGSMSVATDITDKVEAERELRRRAVTDGLTNIYNRAGFIEATERMIDAAVDEGQALSLLVADIDDFKSINDRFGHQTGDLALRAFVDTVNRIIGASFLFGRIGGEEFALTLSQTAAAQAEDVAESIREAVETIAIRTAANEDIRFTVSIGVAELAPEAYSFEQLYAKADQSLYKAKQSGKNRIVLANQSAS
ncbi:diguanylate cyclase [Paenibacillus sp. MBLB4367]|uniref:sensor domain-containing diguanylate cyclase n=1 Tax=Paenibacillus sp. MBLB4367 TaxID=3384767 RepID=UPI0039084590